MDAVKFIKEKVRMCNIQDMCSDCPIGSIKGGHHVSCLGWIYDYPEQAVELVEKWSAEHPRKTMMQDFFEKFPNAPRSDTDGTPQNVCPYDCGYTKDENCAGNCRKCWNRPINE